MCPGGDFETILEMIWNNLIEETSKDWARTINGLSVKLKKVNEDILDKQDTDGSKDDIKDPKTMKEKLMDQKKPRKLWKIL